MSLKLCVLCKSCAFDTRERGNLNGPRGSIWCGRGRRVPDDNAPLVGQREFIEWNRFAARCKHYEPTS